MFDIKAAQLQLIDVQTPRSCAIWAQFGASHMSNRETPGRMSSVSLVFNHLPETFFTISLSLSYLR
tara:strand:- start:5024 stop:5221 length:198 start_codon:yes stop_codon:yes gene_type:complete